MAQEYATVASLAALVASCFDRRALRQTSIQGNEKVKNFKRRLLQNNFSYCNNGADTIMAENHHNHHSLIHVVFDGDSDKLRLHL